MELPDRDIVEVDVRCIAGLHPGHEALGDLTGVEAPDLTDLDLPAAGLGECGDLVLDELVVIGMEVKLLKNLERAIDGCR